MARNKLKNSKHIIPLEVPVDLYTMVDILDEQAKHSPEEFAKIMHRFGCDGDWTLELEYFKIIKKDLKSDYGKEAAAHMQAIIDIMMNHEEE